MVSKHKIMHLIGSASGIAAEDAGCWEGPLVLEKSPYLKSILEKQGIHHEWAAMLQPIKSQSEPITETVVKHCEELARVVANLVQQKEFFTVFGGDHSCAIGTWSGVYSKTYQEGDLGLIWIDAHMDSHTPATSETGNIHGMPLAVLLGYGAPELTNLCVEGPKFKPQNVCLIGARSFEEGEEALLKSLNLRIYFMDEVEQRGLKAIMEEAINLVNANTIGYGITIDVDSIDPREAPGTGVSEAGGLSGDELCSALTLIKNDKRLIGSEIVEFDPHRDQSHMTEKLVARLLASIA
jgi:arginase